MNNFESNVVNNQEQPNTQLATISDRIAAMQARVATPIENWDPQPGDTLIGELHSRREVSGAYGLQQQMVIRTIEGNLIAYYLTKWIEDNLRNQKAQYGSVIALSFLGKRQTSNGKSYNAFELMVDA